MTHNSHLVEYEDVACQKKLRHKCIDDNTIECHQDGETQTSEMGIAIDRSEYVHPSNIVPAWSVEKIVVFASSDCARFATGGN